MRSTLFCAALFLSLAGCASSPESAEPVNVSAAAADRAPPIGKWRLTAFTDSDAAPAATVTLVVQADGKIAGSGGCNSYFGSWALGEEQDTLGPVGATRRLCQAETMAVESKYFDALSRVGGWRATDAGIVLTDSAGEALMTFRAQD